MKRNELRFIRRAAYRKYNPKSNLKNNNKKK